MSDLVYLYGFVPPDTDVPGPELVGLADASVSLRLLDGFHAVVSTVDEEAFSAAAIERRMEDLNWVAEQGGAHERVVAWFVDRAQILPASLFTLYSSEAALAATVRERSDRIRSELERLRGLREWNLKVSCRPAMLAEHAGTHSAVLRELDREIEAASPGRRYLMQKKRGDVLKQEVFRVARQLAAELLDSVRDIAHSVVVLPLPQAGQDLPVVLHAALLVESTCEQQLIQTLGDGAARLQPEGVDVSFSGPWAPYRFVQP